MSKRGILIGGMSYASFCILFLLLKEESRGGDMPFGYEMLIWPIMMFPLGWITSVWPAFQTVLFNLSNQVFGAFLSTDWLLMTGNLLLWATAGGLILRIFRRGE